MKLFLIDIVWEFLDEKNAVVDSSSSYVSTRLNGLATADRGGNLSRALVHMTFEITYSQAVHVNLHSVEGDAGCFSMG